MKLTDIINETERRGYLVYNDNWGIDVKKAALKAQAYFNKFLYKGTVKFYNLDVNYEFPPENFVYFLGKLTNSIDKSEYPYPVVMPDDNHGINFYVNPDQLISEYVNIKHINVDDQTYNSEETLGRIRIHLIGLLRDKFKKYGISALLITNTIRLIWDGDELVMPHSL
jgi:hypothetical protein